MLAVDDAIRPLHLTHIPYDLLNFFFGNRWLRRHITEAPVVLANSTANSARKSLIGMMARVVNAIQE